MPLDILSYLMGKAAGGGGGGGGGGVTILSGTTDPAASQGSNGQLYLKYAASIPGYVSLEYLAVTAAGPYIDTEVVNDSIAYFEIDGQYTEAPGNNYGMFGAMAPGKEFVVNSYGGVSYFEAGADRGLFTAADTSRHTFAGKADGLYLDGSLLTSSVNWNIATGQRYYLFAFSYSPSPSLYPTANTRIYRCKLWSGTDLVRDMIPVQRINDAELGMLDLVNSEFYPNAGSGAFSGGPPTSGVQEVFCKVQGAWQNIIGTDISIIDLGL